MATAQTPTADPDYWLLDLDGTLVDVEESYVHETIAAAGARVPGLDGPVGLVTHCQAYVTGPVLDRLDIRDWFDAVVCCNDRLGWKPDPAPVERAIGALGVAGRDRGVLVGDDPNDVGAAWNAGLGAVHVRRRDPDRVGLCVRSDRQVTSLTRL
ncbi:hypothetical protein BRC62_00815 [Halobacteriales archaeon QH_10_67_13]|nr:MAG: hypothetical protein BRC62_00815 [Halobacteriales archaeon QH_10_67_13]